jgi:hypothetical protein
MSKEFCEFCSSCAVHWLRKVKFGEVSVHVGVKLCRGRVCTMCSLQQLWRFSVCSSFSVFSSGIGVARRELAFACAG